MEESTLEISDRELVDRIIFLHEDMGLGFRRVAKELTSQGFTMGKDKAYRSYLKHRPHMDDSSEDDEELENLKELEKEAQKRLRLATEKEEIRKRIASLIVEEARTSYEKRREIFTDENALLDFAEKTMSVIDPQLWEDFTEFSEEQGYDLADAVAIALGSQRDFEEQLPEGEQRLDHYLSGRIRESLDSLEEEIDEEVNSETNEWRPNINVIIEDD